MRLREYLKKGKYTIKDFAEFIGISKVHLTAIVAGKRSPSKKLAKLISHATLNKVSVDEVFPEGYNNSCPTCGQRLKRKKL